MPEIPVLPGLTPTSQGKLLASLVVVAVLIVLERILDAFKEMPDVAFAYPTQRLYMNPLEGKPEARAPLPPSWG